MQLNADRPRLTEHARLSDKPMVDFMTKDMANRAIAVEAAFLICGGVSDNEVFVSDVLDVAAYLLGDEVPDASIVCGMRDGGMECCLDGEHASVVVEGIHRYGHVTSTGQVFDEEVPF